jgi:DNA mismatch repair ATPase MutS
MNITDDTAGGNSLFKSEVLRAQSLLKTIADLDKKKFSFSIMDEMFSGTSPREGEAAGYAVAKNLGANTNSIAVIATHFPKLKELEKTTGNFKNYQVRVAYAQDGSFTYPFKLEEGAADQNVAIAILQQQGFDSSILDDAQELLKVTPVTAAA